MGLFDRLKNKKDKDVNASSWDAITEVFDNLYPNDKNPKHYAPNVYWELGGNEPLNGVSVYDAGDYYHFITYRLSELYEKESDNKEYSGYGNVKELIHQMVELILFALLVLRKMKLMLKPVKK